MAQKKSEGKSDGSVPAGRADALAALEGLGPKGQPAPAKPDVVADGEVIGEIAPGDARPGSATGFAAILAQNSPGAATTGSGAGAAGSPSMTGGRSPHGAKTASRTRQEFEQLPMAKLVGQKDDSTGHVTIVRAVARPKARSKESYKVLVPIMTVLGFLLLMIGLWALAAVCGMSVPGMPGRHQRSYHASLLKVDFLLLALPVSLALLIMAFMMLRQLDKSKEAP